MKADVTFNLSFALRSKIANIQKITLEPDGQWWRKVDFSANVPNILSKNSQKQSRYSQVHPIPPFFSYMKQKRRLSLI
jgi:hypothetical protein